MSETVSKPRARRIVAPFLALGLAVAAATGAIPAWAGAALSIDAVRVDDSPGEGEVPEGWRLLMLDVTVTNIAAATADLAMADRLTLLEGEAGFPYEPVRPGEGEPGNDLWSTDPLAEGAARSGTLAFVVPVNSEPFWLSVELDGATDVVPVAIPGQESDTPAQTAEAATDTAATESAAEAAADTESSDTVTTEPATTEPATTEPATTESVTMASTEPATAETEPAETEPAETEPAEAETPEPAATEELTAESTLPDSTVFLPSADEPPTEADSGMADTATETVEPAEAQAEAQAETQADMPTEPQVEAAPTRVAVAEIPAERAGEERRLVRGIQNELIRLGYLTGRADGILGPETTAGIEAFQGDAGLAIDGEVSALLLLKLVGTSS